MIPAVTAAPAAADASADSKTARFTLPPPATILNFVVGYFCAFALSERACGTLAVPSPFWLPDAVLLCALLLTPRSQ
jgi:hypothetical protein